MIRAIFFDAVGTLLFPEPSAPVVYATAGRRFGSQLDEATITARFRTAFQRQEELDRAAGLRTDEDREERRWRAIVAEVLDDVRQTEDCFHFLWQHFAQPTAWRVERDAGPVLEELTRRGYRLGLASNFDGRLRRLAGELPALSLLSSVLISAEIGWRKPAAAFFRQMEEATELNREEILVVGDDRINDYEGARSAGLRAVLLDSRSVPGVPETHRLGRLADLPDWLSLVDRDRRMEGSP